MEFTIPTLIHGFMKNMDGSDADKQVFADTWRSGQAMFRDFMGGEKQRSCGKVGKVGEVPSKEEFCFYVRAHKWARKIACSAKVEAEEILENGSAIQEHDIMMKVVKGWVDKGGNARLPYKKAGKGGKVGMCSAGMKKSGGGMKDIPTIYKEINGKVFKGSFCPPKVCSLTQFYFVDFSQWRIGVNRCVFYKRTIKVCVSCC